MSSFGALLWKLDRLNNCPLNYLLDFFLPKSFDCVSLLNTKSLNFVFFLRNCDRREIPKKATWNNQTLLTQKLSSEFFVSRCLSKTFWVERPLKNCIRCFPCVATLVFGICQNRCCFEKHKKGNCRHFVWNLWWFSAQWIFCLRKMSQNGFKFRLFNTFFHIVCYKKNHQLSM